MSDVFISYARTTAAHARFAADALRAAGFSVWFDEQLPTHRAYSDVIAEEIAQAKAVLVIWSNDAIQSQWVRAEADRARGEGKLVQSSIERVQLPMPFDQIHCADLQDWRGDLQTAAWASVLGSISHLAGKKRPAAETTTPESERRRLTVLSCTLVDGAKLAGTLDPEDWLDVSRRFQDMTSAAVGKFGGVVAQAGDHLVAYFGYPVAQEDAAEMAVRAGLAIAAAMPALNAVAPLPHDRQLAAKVGVHVGDVVVAPDAAGKPAVFGDAAAIAARAALAAPSDAVVLSRPVHDLVAGLFVTEAHGELAADHGGGPLPLYRAISAGLARGRARGYAAREPTPFIGREDETELLLSRWKRARDGAGQLVVVIGEPGIGKTRLTDAFRDRIKGEPHLWIQCGGTGLFADSAFYAVIQMLDQGLAWSADESPQRRFQRLERSLSQAGVDATEGSALIAEMLGLPVPDTFAPLELSPDQKRRRLLASLSGWLFAVARNQPLILVIEDLHWIDPSTLELIQTLAEQGATANLLLVCTARPEFRPPWPARSHHAQITLGRLNPAETRELVAGVKARSSLPDDVIEAVIRRADGVPLFAEELTRLVIEGRGALGAHDIPATLLHSLTARIDRLGSAKDVAQLASVLGREFSYPLLQAVCDLSEGALQSALGKLADAELIYVQGYPPEATYQFKHALILDAAYDALLKSTRRELHGRVARAITECFPDAAEAQPEVVARHLSEAGEIQLAIAAWARAAGQAAARAAHVEAGASLRRALDLQRTRPEGAERAQSELSLLVTLAISTAATQGWAAPAVAKTLLEARAICDSLGNIAALFNVLTAICNFQITAADIDAAEQTSRRCQQICRETNDPAHLIQTGTAEGYILYTRGDLAGARRRLEEVADLYAKHDGSRLVYGVPHDPLVTSLIVLASVLLSMGDYAAAERVAEHYMRHARALGQPFALAWALQWRATYCLMTGEYAEALDAADESRQLSEDNDYIHFARTSDVLKGLALGRLGRLDEGIPLFQAAFAERKRAGALGPLGTFLGEAAILLLRAGGPAAALAAVDEAIDLANKSARASLPRLHLHRAEILAAQAGADPAAVADELRQTITLAEQQGAVPDAERARAVLTEFVASARWPAIDAGRPAMTA